MAIPLEFLCTTCCFLQSLISLYSCSSVRPPYPSRLLKPDPFLLIRKTFKIARGKIDAKGACMCWWVKVRPLLHLVLLLQNRNCRARIIWHLMVSQERRTFPQITRTAETTAASACSIMCSQRGTFIYIPQWLSSQKKNISSQLLLPFFRASVPRKSSRAI